MISSAAPPLALPLKERTEARAGQVIPRPTDSAAEMEKFAAGVNSV